MSAGRSSGTTRLQRECLRAPSINKFTMITRTYASAAPGRGTRGGRVNARTSASWTKSSAWASAPHNRNAWPRDGSAPPGRLTAGIGAPAGAAALGLGWGRSWLGMSELPTELQGLSAPEAEDGL